LEFDFVFKWLVTLRPTTASRQFRAHRRRPKGAAGAPAVQSAVAAEIDTSTSHLYPKHAYYQIGKPA